MRTKNVAAVAETTMPTMAASLRLFDLQTKQLQTSSHDARATTSTLQLTEHSQLHVVTPRRCRIAAHRLGSGYTVTYCLTSPLASRCKQATPGFTFAYFSRLRCSHAPQAGSRLPASTHLVSCDGAVQPLEVDWQAGGGALLLAGSVAQ